MSGSELWRVEVVAEVLARRRTEKSAAAVLGLSAHQTRRLVRAHRDGGDILCHREQRHVGDQLTLAYDRKQLILERSAVSEELGGKYVHLERPA